MLKFRKLLQYLESLLVLSFSTMLKGSPLKTKKNTVLIFVTKIMKDSVKKVVYKRNKRNTEIQGNRDNSVYCVVKITEQTLLKLVNKPTIT